VCGPKPEQLERGLAWLLFLKAQSVEPCDVACVKVKDMLVVCCEPARCHRPMTGLVTRGPGVVCVRALHVCVCLDNKECACEWLDRERTCPLCRALVTNEDPALGQLLRELGVSTGATSCTPLIF
jgi:hypothetical protein